MEVKTIEGLGTTIDAILINGMHCQTQDRSKRNMVQANCAEATPSPCVVLTAPFSRRCGTAHQFAFVRVMVCRLNVHMLKC